MARRRSGGGRVTQADVARLAGVSQTVVSMVLNGTGITQHRVGDDTRRRVLDAIERTGYVANPIAQRLAGGKSALVGVYTYEPVFPSSAGDFYQPFLEGVEREAQQRGVDLVLFTSMSAHHGGPLVDGGALHRLRVADGCVLLGRHSHAQDLVALASQDFPYAFVGRRAAPGVTVPFAGADYDEATAIVTRQLLELGHRRIGMVTVTPPHESIEDRVRGYRRAMRAAGQLPVTFEDPDLTSGEFFETLAEHGITAVLTVSDLAHHVYSAALAHGLRVPDDLSIARLGDPEEREPSVVDWAGFTIPRIEMGAEALRIVLRQLTPPDPLEDEPDQGLQAFIPCETFTGSTIAAPPTPTTTSSTTKENSHT
ncbi:LacI family DNA-binding transcriptional regulator [Occultella gossypii]|uniref:LacI family DNA-binding transcriptional regulator n=1 Tax=Occultella gossypii TaxID=2800820 RepID=A0ABS7S3T7_9MICO|nr:LacI family DNA-binding transcriptional regulator [Occultella gossypii]MBZ2195019.1 LacI family DNA-binding transcriptional regulator [Occultella gossypii]